MLSIAKQGAKVNKTAPFFPLFPNNFHENVRRCGVYKVENRRIKQRSSGQTRRKTKGVKICPVPKNPVARSSAFCLASWPFSARLALWWCFWIPKIKPWKRCGRPAKTAWKPAKISVRASRRPWKTKCPVLLPILLPALPQAPHKTEARRPPTTDLRSVL